MSHRRHQISRFSYSPLSAETPKTEPEYREMDKDDGKQPMPMSMSIPGEDTKKLVLFAGVGVLAVIIIDAIVRLACRGGGNNKNTIIIDGKRYIQI